MKNKGFKTELELLEHLKANEKKAITFLTLSGEKEKVTVNNYHHFGHGTKTKTDIVINNNYRLQVKDTNSNRATIINMVPLRNWEILAKRELIDILPVLNAIEKHKEKKQYTVKLKDIANKQDWQELLLYFLFEGTSTYQADPFFQANYLVEKVNGEWLLIKKNEAIDYIWEKLTFEIRTRANKTEPCVHVRVGK